MSERDPRMLPGIPAIVSNTIGAIAALQFLVVLVLALPTGLILEATTHNSTKAGAIFGTVLLIDFAVGLIPSVIFLPLSRAKMHRELEAGYTTVLTEFNQVDGISWRTGQVVRPAVTGTAQATRNDGISSGSELGAVDLGHSWIRTAMGRPLFAPLMGLSFILLLGAPLAIIAIVAPNGGTPTNSQTGIVVTLVFVAIAGLCGLIITPVEYAVFFLPRYYRSRLAAHFPDARVLIGAPESLDVVSELLGAAPAELPHARRRGTSFVVVESGTLTLFSRYKKTALPYLSIPRSRISEAVVGSTSSYLSNNMPYPDVALTVTKDNGTGYTFQLVIAVTKGGYRSPQLLNDCSWVVDWVRPTTAEQTSSTT